MASQPKPAWLTYLEEQEKQRAANPTPVLSDATGVSPYGTPTKVVDGKTYYQMGNTWGTVDLGRPNSAQIAQMKQQLETTGTVSDYYKERFGIGNTKPTYTYYDIPSGMSYEDYLKSGQIFKDSGKTTVNTLRMPDGRLLDTTNMTAGQIWAADLWARNPENARALLRSAGYDDYGNRLPDYLLSNDPAGILKSQSQTTNTLSAPAYTSTYTSAYAPTSAPSSSGLTASQKAAQDYIIRSGHWGTLDDYINNNIRRYLSGEITYDRLLADAQRVGYVDRIQNLMSTNIPANEQPDEITPQDFIYLFMQALNPAQQQQAQLEQLAAQQAAQRVAEQRALLNNLINSLQQSQNADLEAIMAGLAQTRQDIEDDTFQRYLQARQMMADRGLAGSGIASDQDTRLLMDRGRQLARANQNAEAQAQQVRAMYSNRLADAYTNLSNLNQSALQQQIYMDLLNSAQQDMLKRAELFMEMFEKMSDREFNYDKLSSEERRFYDKLNSDEKLAYAQMNSEIQQLMMKLAQEYDLEMTKIMGYDQQGRPTLDALKLAEQIRANKANEYLSARQIAVNAANNAARIAESARQFNAEVELKAAQLLNSQWEQQGQNLTNLIKAKGDEIAQLAEILRYTDEKDPQYKVIQNQISNAISQHESYVLALEDLTYNTKPVSQTQKSNALKRLWDNTFGKLFKKKE